MYSERILELFKNPVNAGGLQGANGVGKFVDESCGDSVKLYLKIDENKIITEARFKAIGCVGTIVGASAMCSCLLDCTIDEALTIDKNRIYDVTGIFPTDKEYSIDYSIKALKLAIDNYYVNLEKEQKKLEAMGGVKPTPKAKKEQKQEKQEQSNPEITSQVTERRNVSAAKAAFDALFDL